MKGIRVYVVDIGRRHLVLRARDPVTKKLYERKTETHNKADAQRAACAWESEIERLGLVPGEIPSASTLRSDKATWELFDTRYTNDCLSGLKATTRSKAAIALAYVETYLMPQYVSDVTSERIAQLQGYLRNEKGCAETTIDSYMAHIRAALQWAKDLGWISAVPKIPKVHRSKKRSGRRRVMKGRGITQAEFDKMLEVAPLVVGADAAPGWRHYLRGMWTGGLRLAESLELCWDNDEKMRIVANGQRLALSVPTESEKGAQDRLLPLAPEFEMFLRETPESQRTGLVFNIPAIRNQGRVADSNPCKYHVSRTVMAIGKKAEIIVNTGTGKFASAHDLRRSFGERWAHRVMPQTLMELMRHENIETTMTFYVQRQAASTAEILWAALDGKVDGKSEVAEKKN